MPLRRHGVRGGVREERPAALHGALLVALHRRDRVAHLGDQDRAPLARRGDAGEGARLGRLRPAAASASGRTSPASRSSAATSCSSRLRPARSSRPSRTRRDSSRVTCSREVPTRLAMSLCVGAGSTRAVRPPRHRRARLAARSRCGARLGAELEQAVGQPRAPSPSRAAQQALAHRGVIGEDGAERLRRHRGDQRLAQRDDVGKARAASIRSARRTPRRRRGRGR